MTSADRKLTVRQVVAGRALPPDWLPAETKINWRQVRMRLGLARKTCFQTLQFDPWASAQRLRQTPDFYSTLRSKAKSGALRVRYEVLYLSMSVKLMCFSFYRSGHCSLSPYLSDTFRSRNEFDYVCSILLHLRCADKIIHSRSSPRSRTAARSCCRPTCRDRTPSRRYAHYLSTRMVAC